MKLQYPVWDVRISTRARCATSCDNVCQWLATGRCLSPGTPITSTDNTDWNDITEILLKMALNTIKQTKTNKNCLGQYSLITDNIRAITLYFMALPKTDEIAIFMLAFLFNDVMIWRDIFHHCKHSFTFYMIFLLLYSKICYQTYVCGITIKVIMYVFNCRSQPGWT